MEAADVVARQVDAYNAHDLEAFLACYTDDVVVTSGEGTVLLEGLVAVREQYAAWFGGVPDLHTEVRHRMVRGSWVVDDEHATATGLDVEALVAYHVRADRIARVVLMTAESEGRPVHR
jgi:uncharacterized protein (TIGR02246 family)